MRMWMCDQCRYQLACVVPIWADSELKAQDEKEWTVNVIVEEGGVPVADSAGDPVVLETTFSSEGPQITATKAGWKGEEVSTIFEANTKTPFRIADPDSDVKKVRNHAPHALSIERIRILLFFSAFQL